MAITDQLARIIERLDAMSGTKSKKYGMSIEERVAHISEQLDNIESGGGGERIPFVILSPSDLDPETGVPIIDDPSTNTFYLAPTRDTESNLFDEWIYIDDEWELFGSGGSSVIVEGGADWSAASGTAGYIANKPAVYSGSGTKAIAENNASYASGNYSHAEGYETRATASNAHAEGNGSAANGAASHAEGNMTIASMVATHAEGAATTASANYAHAEGNATTASGQASHSEGYQTTASGDDSHAEGNLTKALGSHSHAEGDYTTASRSTQHVFGKYNIEDTNGLSSSNGKYVEIVGNGSGIVQRSNARTLDWNGNEWLAGNLTLGSTTLTEVQLQALLALLG